MKANEAPEKLYISDSELNDAEHCVIWFKSQQNKNDIEYTRTDAFIEKAEEFIYSALNDGIMGTANIEDFMRLFKSILKENLVIKKQNQL